MKVKICGIKDVDTGVQVAKLQPDYIGYVMSRSKRQISADHAAAIIKAIGESCELLPKMTAVYSTVTREVLYQELSRAPFDAVQFHMPADMSIVKMIKEKWNVKICLTLPVQADLDPVHEGIATERLWQKLAPYQQCMDVLLLDTHDPLHGGGSGKVFQWEAIPVYKKLAQSLSLPLYAAGGLRADNVRLLKQQYALDGVDVSSGVETSGEKDLLKVQQFIERVRG